MQTKVSRAPRLEPPPETVVWLFDWTPPHPEEAQSESGAVDGDKSGTSEPPAMSQEPDVAAESATVAAEPSSESPEANDTLAPRNIDWEAAVGRAIERMREENAQTGRYVPFGTPMRSDDAPDWRYSNSRDRPEPPRDLDVPPERSSFGELIVPVGNGCYQVSGSASILVEATLSSFSNYYDLPRTECPRPAGVRDDLFAEQKPAYLK